MKFSSLFLLALVQATLATPLSQSSISEFAKLPETQANFNSIAINAVSAPASGQAVEYAINTENTVPENDWQTELAFSGLASNTTYSQNNWSDEDYDVSWYFSDQTMFAISTVEQLAGLMYLVNTGTDNFSGKRINLTSNISLNDTANWQNWATATSAEVKLWTPIGTSMQAFSGTFNGNGFVISGLYIDNTDDHQGLFGVINAGKIEKLGVVASYVKGANNVGGLVGSSANAIIENCFSRANAAGISNIGGLVGYSINTAVTASYAASNNELIGTRIIGSVTSSYFLAATSENEVNGFARTDEQMKTQSTYLGWNFSSPIWKIDDSNIINNGYPYLQTLEAACFTEGKIWENNFCRNKTDAELCTEFGNNWVDGECKTAIQLAQGTCVANGRVWEDSTCRDKTDVELCIEADNNWINGQCKTDAQLEQESCIADGKIWENNICRVPIIRIPQIANAQISVQTKGNKIVLQNLPANAKVELYNLQGKRIYSANPENPKILEIGVQTKGLYIAKISFGSEKQILRIPLR